MQGHRESIILGKNLNTGETEGVLVGLHPFIHDSSIKKFLVAHCLGIETGNRIGGKSMRVRPGVACNHSQFQQFIAGK